MSRLRFIHTLAAGIWISFLCGWAVLFSQAYAAVFEVGPGQAYRHIFQVPLDSLDPGDVVKIYYREKPYNEKFILRRSGTSQAPIVITGIPSGGKLPVIEGRNAVQQQNDFAHNTGRYLIKIGEKEPGDFVVIRNLHLRNANNSNVHVSDEKELKSYTDNAAGIFLFHGRHVTISKCVIESCGDGILTNYSPNVTHATISHCYFSNNGNFKNPGSSQEHNIYLQGKRSTVEFSYFGPPHSNGHLIKDRGWSTVIRYNWISGGANRQLDLVDHEAYDNADAFVYGNVIVQGRQIQNYNMIHFGGDSVHIRTGDLFFFNNTVVSNSANTIFIYNRFSRNTLFLMNNAFVGQGTLWNGKGRLRGHNNWINQGVKGPFDWTLGTRGRNPGFLSGFIIPYVPSAFSPLIDKGSNRTPFPVEYMPKPNGGGVRRPKRIKMDIGAYEAALHWFKPKQ